MAGGHRTADEPTAVGVGLVLLGLDLEVPGLVLEAKAAAAGRAALARQVLAALSTKDLHAEVERRDRTERDQLDQEGRDDAARDLRADLGIP